MDRAIATQTNPPTSIITFSSSIAPLCMYQISCFKILLLVLSLTNDFIVTRYNPPFIAGHDDFVYLLAYVIGMYLIVFLCYSVHYTGIHMCTQPYGI